MEIQKIPLSRVMPSPMNPRKTFDEGELQELADNIEKQGLLQPITVRPIPESYKGTEHVNIEYEIVCGERRYRAFGKLSEKWASLDSVAPKGMSYNRFSEIPAIIREMNDDEAFDAMITENLQRKDVDPIEEAFAFGMLAKNGKSIEEIATRFGKSVRFVQDRIRLNSLIPELMAAVKDDNMSISAAMIISKLAEETQRNYYSTYANNAAGYTKATAESFTNSIFMAIDASPWYKSGTQEGKDYAGGCGRKCSECTLNTANHGCLFWSMKTEDAGRCTDRDKFFAKHAAYLIDAVNSYGVTFVKRGEPLETGKAVIIDEDSWCTPNTKKLKEHVHDSLRELGLEVIKVNEIFGTKCYYSEDDERLKKLIEEGRVYQCLKLFNYDRVGVYTEWWYFKGKHSVDNTASSGISTTSQSVEAMKLVEKRSRIKQIANDKLASNIEDMASNLGEAKRKGELSDTELFVFQTIILTLCGSKMLEKYGHTSLGIPTEASFLDVVKQNRADWTMWIRDFIRQAITTGLQYNALYLNCAGKVLEEWLPKEYGEMVHKVNEKLTKDLTRNAEKLKALGYDADGRLLPKPEKDTPANPEPDKPKIPDMKGIEKQFKEKKAKHPDAVILVRVGDFYECIDEDAEKVAKTLGLTITSNKKGKLTGFPLHALDTYLPRLIRAGLRVAISEENK